MKVLSWNEMREQALEREMDALQNDTLAMRLARFNDEEFERSERLKQQIKKRAQQRKFNNE